MTAEVLHIAHKLKTPQERVQWLKDNAPKPAQVAISSVAEALAWGDGWQAYALRLEAQNARLQMLADCAQVHASASDLLREYAEGELERIRKVNRGT